MDDAKIKILCVDDQRSNLIALEAIFSRLQYQLIQVQSGAEAIAAVDQHDFAVILLDVQMPVMDGFKTARGIRANSRSASTPIIFLTADYPSEECALQGYEAGAVDYLFKPLNLQMLRAKVAVFVDLFLKNIKIKNQTDLLLEIERRDQERELQQVKQIGEKKYRDLVEGIREGIVWSADPDTLRFSFVSRYADKITGYPVERWLKEPDFWRQCLVPGEKAQVLNSFQSALHDKRRSGVEHQFIKADGTCIWLYTEVHLGVAQTGALPELQGLSVDITHLKETEAALRDAIRVREDFLSIASHELKTPITPLLLQLQGFIRLLETGRLLTTDPRRLREMLEVSNTQVIRLSRLVGQLLDVSRLREGKLSLDVDRVELTEVVRDVISQLRGDFDASECRVSFKFEEQGFVGQWDRLRLEQVIINLLMNSIKYAAGKPIEVTLARQGDQAILKVRDEGMGIAKADQERIFGRFERAVPIKNYGGLGLGLFISREIVHMHLGRIEVESEPGQGAVFTIRLPLG